MALTNPDKVVTEERLNEYHRTILPYLGGNSMVACGGGYAPIGTVIAYMGTRAPSDFLICDGTVYNIADYTELADFFELQFGSNNFFGGDGNTTFAVPDLRGEFLRGTGTNSHANQGSGANVGVHQDGTESANLFTNTGGTSIYVGASGSYWEKALNPDFVHDSAFDLSVGGGKDVRTLEKFGNYTSRPTNTSVLYCIKAKSQGNGYSLDEQIVGTWIDGKPIYQKTIDFGALPNKSSKSVAHGISNIDKITELKGIAIGNNIYQSIPTVNDSLPNQSLSIWADNTNVTTRTTNTDFSGSSGYVTLQYTKTTD